MNNYKALVLGTSHKTKGGVTSVINMHAQCDFWRTYHIRWIETHIDKGVFWKLLFALKAFFQYISCIWFYDIVHFHIGELPSARRKFLFFIIAKLLRKKTVIHLHIGNQLDYLYTNWLYKILFMKANSIIVLSYSIQRKVKDLFHVNEKVDVVYNSCPVVSEVEYTSSNHTLLFAGTLNANKGYDILIRAFANIATEFPEWKLVLAGSGEIAKAKELINSLQVSSQVILSGWIQGQQKELLFRQASVFCLASYAEGFPMSILDAWAYGLPVVTTPVGGLTDVVDENKNALLFVPGDIQMLSKQLRNIFTSEELRKKLSKESLHLAHTIFSMDQMNKKIEVLYEKLFA